MFSAGKNLYFIPSASSAKVIQFPQQEREIFSSKNNTLENIRSGFSSGLNAGQVLWDRNGRTDIDKIGLALSSFEYACQVSRPQIQLQLDRKGSLLVASTIVSSMWSVSHTLEQQQCANFFSLGMSIFAAKIMAQAVNEAGRVMVDRGEQHKQSALECFDLLSSQTDNAQQLFTDIAASCASEGTPDH